MIATAPTSATTGCYCVCYDCGGQNTGCTAGTWVISTNETVVSSNWPTREDLEWMAEVERLARELKALRAKRARHSDECRRLMIRDGRRPARPHPPFVPTATELYKTVRQMHAV